MRKRIFISLALLCSIFIEAQNINKTDLDNLLVTFESNNKAMGTVSIFKNGKEVYQKSIGYRNLPNKQKANSFTKYRIGSITKTFTAAVIMQLIDEQKLKLNTSLKEYFPTIPNADKITIEHLLYHRSGLHNITSEKGFEVWISKPRNRKEMLSKFIKNGIDFEPDTKTAYSNTNYILLSYIAENIDKKSYSKIIRNRIVKPLGLERTEFGKKIKAKKNEALSYYREDSQWKPITLETNLKGTMGAGGIVSNAKELNIFYSNLFTGKLTSKKALQKMMTSNGQMGIGMSEFTFKGLKIYGHDGAIDGFRSISAYIPKKKIAISFTFNASTLSSTPTLVALLEAYFKNDTSLQNKSSIQLTAKELDNYLGIYSGSTFPATVTFTKKGNTLFAQATGQPIFKLTAIKKEVFTYDSMGIIFSFNLKDKTMFLNFGGKKHLLKKE